MQVGEALAADPRTGDAVIEVINVNGVITLAGTVQDTSVKQAAEEIARSQPGVISVINALRLKQR
jgi:osmotically-inducible protein OsmY